MANDLDIQISSIKRRTIAEHLRKTARDIAIIGIGCSLFTLPFKDSFSKPLIIGLAAAAPIGCLFYLAALLADRWVKRIDSEHDLHS